MANVPWSDRYQWNQANLAIHKIITEDLTIRSALESQSKQILSHIQLLSPLLNRLCHHLCEKCPSPCCKKASIYYDLKDLLFIHTLCLPVPLSQPIRQSNLECSNLGPYGCQLPREIRPWICTWYICPDQYLYMDRQRGNYRSFITEQLWKMKSARNKMETQFIDISTSPNSR